MKKYLMIAFILLLVSCFTEPKSSNISEPEKGAYQDPTETSSDHINSSSYIAPISNKKFVYVEVKISKPVLYGTKYDTYYNTPSTYKIEYENETYTTDITEIDSYNEDEKYKMIDKAEKNILQRFSSVGHNIYAEAVVNYGDIANELKDNNYKIKIVNTEVKTFNSYAEASKSKK